MDDIKTFHKERDALLEILNTKTDLISRNYIYYVEWMAKHTVDYQGKIGAFIGLDIRLKPLNDEEPVKFLMYDDKIKEFEKLGIPAVALKWRGLAKEVNEDLLKELIKSSSYYEGMPEGVVIKNYGRINQFGKQIYAKVVNDNFSEHSKSRTNKVRPSDDTGLIVDTFITEARVNKRILSLINEGKQELGMELMRFLPMQVVQDVFKEESEWMLKNCKIVDFSALKSFTSKKCVILLNEFINKNGLNKQ
jgi:hypothetical protein